MDHEGASGGGKKLLYVGGLAEEVDEKTLQAAFIPFGDIVEVILKLLLNGLYEILA